MVLQLGQKILTLIYTYCLVSVKCLPNSYKCTLLKILNLTFCGGKHLVFFCKVFRTYNYYIWFFFITKYI